MPRTHMFRGQRWRFGRLKPPIKGAVGCVDYVDHIMDIPLDGDTLDELDTVIHEGLHAVVPDLVDEVVEQAAGDIALILWRLGWRNES